MRITVINESGYNEAILGISLSYGTCIDRAIITATRLCKQEGGHNKFLESICIWISVDAPRYFWQQFDTYRVGVTKQSESTMHTILKRELSIFDFENPINRTILDILNQYIRDKNFDAVKDHLPEGYLQRRIICTNYKSLRNILRQRLTHRLPQWQTFIKEVYEQCKHKDFLSDLYTTP